MRERVGVGVGERGAPRLAQVGGRGWMGAGGVGGEGVGGEGGASARGVKRVWGVVRCRCKPWLPWASPRARGRRMGGEGVEEF